MKQACHLKKANESLKSVVVKRIIDFFSRALIYLIIMSHQNLAVNLSADGLPSKISLSLFGLFYHEDQPCTA